MCPEAGTLELTQTNRKSLLGSKTAVSLTSHPWSQYSLCFFRFNFLLLLPQAGDICRLVLVEMPGPGTGSPGQGKGSSLLRGENGNLKTQNLPLGKSRICLSSSYFVGKGTKRSIYPSICPRPCWTIVIEHPLCAKF